MYWLQLTLSSCSLHETLFYWISIGISSVEELDFHLNNSSPSLLWFPPSFYSRDIPQGSITTYHVYVKNQDGSVIVDDNTTDTFYELPNKFTVCDIYTANITAFIEQYTSINVSSTKEYSGSKLTTYYQI